jgi:hypothetical protein
VGVLEVDKSISDDADRCINLQKQLRSILKPPPDHAFIEPFFGHGRQSDAISYMLRGAIMMELKEQRLHDRIEYTEVPPQTWKNAIAGKGVCAAAAKSAKASAEASSATETAAKAAASFAEKAAVKAAIEQMTGFCFPTALYVDGKWSVDKKRIHDASDAAAIGLCGVQQYAALAFAASLRVSAPGLPRPRSTKPLASLSMASALASNAPAAAAATTVLAPDADSMPDGAGLSGGPVAGSPPRSECGARGSPPSRSGRQPKRKERFEAPIDEAASKFKSPSLASKKPAADASIDMGVPEFVFPGEEIYAMGLWAGNRKRFRARVSSVRPQFPRIVVHYTSTEDGVGSSALELPEMQTAYLHAGDVEPRDW